MATIRTNEIHFEFKQETELSFILSEIKVSSNQPYEEIVKVEAENSGKTKWKLTVRAGRHKTKEVADWFNKFVSKDQCMAHHAYSKTPDELNFGIKGTLCITENGEKFEIPDFILAQGSNNLHDNNWWIGGKYCVTIFDKTYEPFYYEDNGLMLATPKKKTTSNELSNGCIDLYMFYSDKVDSFKVGWLKLTEPTD